MTEFDAQPFDAPPFAFGRSVLDRIETTREDHGELEQLWAHPASVLVDVYGSSLPVDPQLEGQHPLIRATVDSGAELDECFLLGSFEGRVYFGRSLDPQTAPGDLQLVTLREAGYHLSEVEAEAVVTTVALSNWHRTHQFCPRCGQPTKSAQAGWLRLCIADNSEHYPRTDPAVIMLITDSQDRALLGRRVGWEDGRYSTLAGFVEPGEPAERAVVRECAEEVNVAVDPSSVIFKASQPWPFPSSLMIGFHARAYTDDDPRPDGTEIVEAAWFTRDQLAQACEEGSVRVPPRISISRYLIEDWYGGELPGVW